MNTRFYIQVAFASLLAVTACGQPFGYESQLRQLTLDEHKCQKYSPEQIAEFNKTLPADFIQNYSAEEKSYAINELTGIPPKYMQWLYGVNGFHITGAGGKMGGVTSFDEYPKSMEIGTRKIVTEQALQHEIGHALTPFFKFHVSNEFGSQWDATLIKEGKAQHDNKNLNAYPAEYWQKGKYNTYYMEFFAEAFNSYYCSPTTNKMVAEQFPTTYAWLASFLEAPVWAASSTPNTSGINVNIAGQANGQFDFAIAADPTAEQAFLCNYSKDECAKDLANTTRQLTYLNLAKKTPLATKSHFSQLVTLDTNKPVTIVVFQPGNKMILRTLELSR